MISNSLPTIVIFCAGLEPQRDGIGDYTRMLANQLSVEYNVIVCGIHDEYVQEICLENDSYTVVRYPSILPWATRANQLLELLEHHQPIWVSLQLAPFGLQKKGIIYEPAKHLIKVLKGYPTHVFVHELWLGAEDGASLKMKIWGQLIKYFLIKLIKNILPSKVYVSCEVNQFLLEKEGITTDIVPVFSNIPIAIDVDKSFLTEIISQSTEANFKDNISNFIIVGFFGVIHPYWNPEKILRELETVAMREQKGLLFIFIGKIDDVAIKKIINMMPSNALHYKTGLLDKKEISGFLQLCNIGVTSNPEIMLGKSGTVAAFLLHQKPVIVYKNEIKVADFELKEPISDLILYPSQLHSLKQWEQKSIVKNQKFEVKTLALKMSLDMKV